MKEITFSSFKKSHEGMDFTLMSPPCIGITFFNPDTQRAYVEWFEAELERINRTRPPYIEVNGVRAFGRWESLERLR